MTATIGPVTTATGAATGAAARTGAGTATATPGSTADYPRVVHASAREAAQAALGSAVDHLLRLQNPDGWWKGELETNVTMDAEDLLVRHVLGVRNDDQTAASARWIRSQQRADGSWATFYGGPGESSATVEAYVALRLAGDRPEEDHLQRAAAYVRGAGGVPATRVFTRIWLALVGLWPWEQLPAMPPEAVLLPAWSPMSIYDFGCWARQTVVPITVVWAHRPVHPVDFCVDELYRPGGRPGDERDRGQPSLTDRAFGLLDRALKVYERHHLRPLRRWALRRAASWILERQEADGSWGGIQPPWVYSLMALRLSGYAIDHPALRAAMAGLDSFTVREDGSDGPVRRLEACQSPVWDTCLAVVGLGDAGVPADHPAMQRAARWLLDERVEAGGDWQVRRPDLPRSAWAFEFANDCYPDIDDTAEVILALRRCAVPDHEVSDAAAWTLGMQSRDGGWGAFDADNTRRWPRMLPFCDFGEVIDPPTADVTAHVVEMLCGEGLADDPRVRRGLDWLLADQELDGSWFGRWGVNHVYGTGAVLPALVAAGLPTGSMPIRRAVRWLLDHQQPAGGWGEDIRSYADPAWRGRGAAPASQTAWALLGLLAAGEHGEAVERGVRWLVKTQRPDGTWDEPYYTGTGFPLDFSINYHLYRLVFPVTALGRYLSGAPLGLGGAR
jgi:squalene-hopene/tetraprenyl-beta-curcumene cyclase